MPRLGLLAPLALTLACSKTPPPADGHSSDAAAQAGATPAAPATADPEVPTVAVGSGKVVPGPCARIGEQPWRCLDPELPFASRPEVVAVDGALFSNLCMLSKGGKLECLFKGAPSYSFEHVDDFELGGQGLLVASEGRRGSTSLMSDTGLRFVDTELDGSIVEISDSCNRTRNGVLHCFEEQVQGVEEFCTGRDHFCARVGEQVICGGGNRRGQLGLGHLDAVSGPPQPVIGLPPAVHVSCSSAGSCALTQTGEVWCWGEDQDGELGQPPWIEDGSTPVPIANLHGAVGFELLGGYGCAVLADGELACWGSAADELPQIAAAPKCIELELDAWKRSLETAAPGGPTSELLAKLGLSRRWLLWPKTPGMTPLSSNAVDIIELELDGAAPSERLVTVHLRTSQEQRCAIVALRADAEGRWCAIDDGLSFDQPFDRQPAESWPEHLDFNNPCKVDKLELTAAGRHAIELIESGGETGRTSVAAYVLRYFELRDDQFVELFGPFPLFEHITGAGSQPSKTGSVTLSGEFPKRIETETRAGGKTSTRSWSFDGQVYR